MVANGTMVESNVPDSIKKTTAYANALAQAYSNPQTDTSYTTST